MSTYLTNFVCGEEGATIIEYGLMLAFIALICVGAVAAIGPSLSAKFMAVIPALQ